MARPNPTKIVFARTGWMVWYDYSREHHAPLGGGSYNDDEVGSEVNNFRRRERSLYGFVRTGEHSGFNLARIDPSATGDFLDGVLVLLYATASLHRGQRLIGWYRDARCYPDVRRRPGNLSGTWHFS